MKCAIKRLYWFLWPDPTMEMFGSHLVYTHLLLSQCSSITKNEKRAQPITAALLRAIFTFTITDPTRVHLWSEKKCFTLLFLKPSQNKKGQKIFQLLHFLFFSLQLAAEKKESKIVQLEIWPFLFCDSFSFAIR